MNKDQMNNLCKMAIARVESRKILGMNHKRMKSLKILIKPDTQQFKQKITDNLHTKQRYANNMTLGGTSDTITQKLITYEDLPTSASLIKTPEDLAFYKLCYAIIYKSTKVIPRGSRGYISVNQSNRHGSMSTSIKVDHLINVENVVEEVLLQITDIAMANYDNATTDMDTDYVADTFRYREFRSNHLPGLNTFTFCFEPITTEVMSFLYKKNMSRKPKGALEMQIDGSGWFEIGRTMIQYINKEGSYTSQYSYKAIGLYEWGVRRDQKLPKALVDNCKEMFIKWRTAYKEYIGRECGWQKKTKIEDLMRNGHMPV